ncbi:MAG: F0F1 ATP synthase subunit A [Candidatus Lambdaproteobacteria bacterium]|nr:F0F1 ATP synthase subunit A [Candidatus Lambdaproteobacteria bacterium]
MSPIEHGGGLALGPLVIALPVLTTWGIMAVLALLSWLVTRRLSEQPGVMQLLCEGVVSAMAGAVEGVLPGKADQVMPFIGTLWIFIVVANLVGLVPGLDSPTADLGITASLAILVFLSVHWYGIRNEGLAAYLRHYLRPMPLMLPFHIMSEITRTVALAVRLFGNVMSLETAALIVLLLAKFLVPVPVMMLHIVEALVQAYIFGMLALVYIAGAMQAHHAQRAAPKE